MATDTTARCADPLTRGLFGPAGPGVTAGLPALPGLPEPQVLLGMLGTWHGRGVQVGFPDLTAEHFRPRLPARPAA
ncbi:hypothetical protein [Streptomyces sp. NPDC093225]|uniref:hypothetical protein n=1 Tax=Streptomyces sp. NPDC093225 TaxID=3366034 RepID=UPI00381D39A0